MSPDKAAHLAIDIARESGRRIVVIGKCSEPDEQAYFDAEVKPRLGPDVDYHGEIELDEKYDLLGGAAAFVFPLQWEEPFGMVLIEAMACGTPVLSLARGAVPEVVVDGVTGFVRTGRRRAHRLPSTAWTRSTRGPAGDTSRRTSARTRWSPATNRSTGTACARQPGTTPPSLRKRRPRDAGRPRHHAANRPLVQGVAHAVRTPGMRLLDLRGGRHSCWCPERGASARGTRSHPS